MTGGTHSCARTGAVVSARHLVPEPPYEWWWGGGVTVGCNHLRCGDCGAIVRQHPGLRLGRTRDVPAPEVVYDTADWATLPGLISDERSRLYACRCRLHAETAEHLLDVVPREITDLDLPWSCDGHPPVPFPLDVDGVHLDSGTDARALALDVLRGRRDVPAWADVSAHHAFWLERVAGLIPAFEEGIASAAVEVLADDDSLAAQRALDWLRVRPRWWPGVDVDTAISWEITPVPPWGELSLGHVAGRALARRIRWEAEHGGETALDAAVDWLRAGVAARALAWTVADHDIGAFIEAFPEAVAAAPSALPDLLRPLAQLRPEAVALALRRLKGIRRLAGAQVPGILEPMAVGREEALRAWAELSATT